MNISLAARGDFWKGSWALLAMAVLAGGCASRGFAVHDIPNFRAVPGDPGVYRGGQPGSPAAWAYLHSLGISNVVKLNLRKEGSDDRAAALGMTIRYFPIHKRQELALKPDASAVAAAVAAIQPGTYVHCEHGQDRTGLIIACKRVWEDGWSKTDARKEMLEDGFHPALHGLNDFWEDNVR